MSGVDFVKQKDEGKTIKSGRESFDIEYTNPNSQIENVPKKKAWWQNFGGGSAKSGQHVAAATPQAVAPVMAHAKPIVEHAKAVGVATPTLTKQMINDTKADLAKKNTIAPALPSYALRASEGRPVTAPKVVLPQSKLSSHVLPAPPPPPLHPAPVQPKTVQPKPVLPVLKSVTPTPAAKPVMQPVKKVAPVIASPIIEPVVTKPVAPILKPKPVPPIMGRPASSVPVATPNKTAAPTQAAVHKTAVVAGNDSAIHVQHVDTSHGQITNPAALTKNGTIVNLLPRTVRVKSPVAKWEQLVQVVLVAVIMIEVTYAAIIGEQIYYYLQITGLQQSMQVVNQQVAEYAPLQKKIGTLNLQLSTINTLLQQHIYWTNVFAVLEKYTLSNVYYTNVTCDPSGNVTLQALTTNFASVTHQVNVLKQATNFIQTVQVTSASTNAPAAATTANENTNVSNQSIVAFNITLQLNPDVLHYHPNAYFQ